METTAESDRYQRYKQVLDIIAEREVFGLDQLKQDCEQEQPAFVTRVVNELTSQGWLVCENLQGQLRFRWNERRGRFDTESWLNRKLVGTRIAATPPEDRPRERLLRSGAANLRTAELLAILIRSGRTGESALQAGEKIANHFASQLQNLPAAGRGEMQRISEAVGEAAYCQIMAGIELGRRVAEQSDSARTRTKISSTTEAIAFCEQHFQRLVQDGAKEEFHIVTLNTKNQVLSTHQISVGTLDASLVHPREVFRPAIKDAAAAVILVHNHPSGDPTPSREDLRVTERLDSAGKNLGIDVLDHIVLGAFRSVSIREVA